MAVFAWVMLLWGVIQFWGTIWGYTALVIFVLWTCQVCYAMGAGEFRKDDDET